MVGIQSHMRPDCCNGSITDDVNLVRVAAVLGDITGLEYQ
jgi:hypothetical protein